MIFVTKSGSRYEVDEDARTIRRIAGLREPTERIAAGRKYERIDGIVAVGLPVTIVWGEDTPLLEGSPAGAVKTTITSPVIEVSP